MSSSGIEWIAALLDSQVLRCVRTRYANLRVRTLYLYQVKLSGDSLPAATGTLSHHFDIASLSILNTYR